MAAPAPGPDAGMLPSDGLPPGQLVDKVPPGDVPSVENILAQPIHLPSWVWHANQTSGMTLAYSGNFNNTKVPGLGPVQLPSPFFGLGPNTIFSRWYDYMTQPVVPDGVTYTTTMQGPDYYYGVLFDRGDNDRIGSNDVQQGQLPDCAFGAAMIAMAESGVFDNYLPLSIAPGAPRPYFDIYLYLNGQAATQHIDDMLPWVGGLQFLSYQPTADALDTPAVFNNANTVLSVPYIEKGFAKLLDKHPSLKSNASASGYSALTGISAGLVLSAIRNVPAVEVSRKNNANWESAVLDCMLTPAYPCVFGTPDSPDDLRWMADSYNAATQTATWNDGGATLQWVTRNGNDLLLYNNPGSPTQVFVAEHAYGMMRNVPFGFAMLGNPWGFNTDPFNNVIVPEKMGLMMSGETLSRVTVSMAR